jgi:hypothetical protein
VFKISAICGSDPLLIFVAQMAQVEDPAVKSYIHTPMNYVLTGC